MLEVFIAFGKVTLFSKLLFSYSSYLRFSCPFYQKSDWAFSSFVWKFVVSAVKSQETQEPSKTAHEFQVLVAKAAETLMEKLGIGKEVGFIPLHLHAFATRAPL